MDDELLKQKYPSMYEGEKSDIADLKSEDTTPSLGGSRSKPKKGTEADLPMEYRGMNQAKGKIFYREDRLRDYDEAASESSLPEWLKCSLRQRLETEMRNSVSIFDLKDNDSYSFEGMLAKLNSSFPEGSEVMQKLSQKYPSMGSVKDTIQSWCAEGYEEPDPDEEETEVVDEL